MERIGLWQAIFATFAVTTGVAVAAACSAGSSVVASEYDQSCATDTDCSLVPELTVKGSDCNESCPEGAISRKVLEQYRLDLIERKKSCTSLGQPGCRIGGVQALCRASKCAAVDCAKESCPGADAGAD